MTKMVTYIGEQWLGLQQAMHSGHYTLFIRSFNSMFLLNEFFHGVIINYTKTIVLTSAIQVMHK